MPFERDINNSGNIHREDEQLEEKIRFRKSTSKLENHIDSEDHKSNEKEKHPEEYNWPASKPWLQRSWKEQLTPFRYCKFIIRSHS
jgi:hypothetical protein